MSVLLCDGSLCSSEFGRILFSPVSDWSIHVKVTGVNKAGSPLSQHAEYTLKITAIPRNCLELDPRTFCISNRYKEFNRLWNQLSKIHKQLYLHGSFPLFAPAKIFGSTEPAVIAERVDAITRFLNFVFANEVLRKAICLHHFFEGVTEMEAADDGTRLVSSSGVQLGEAASGEILLGVSVAPTELVEGEDLLEGVPPSTSQLCPSEEESAEGLVLSSRAEYAVTSLSSDLNMLPHSSSSCLLFDFPDADLQTSKGVPAKEHPSTVSVMVEKKIRRPDRLLGSRESRFFVREMLPEINHLTNAQHHRVSNSDSQDSFTAQRSPNSGSFFQRTDITGVHSQSSAFDNGGGSGRFSVFPTMPSSLAGNSTNKNDYLATAAQFISAAEKAEAENAFELAFQCYKSAVKVLLQGVQFERDLPRRNRVRKKTAKYLLKAEKLYRSYLSFDGSTFESASWVWNTVQDPNLLAFQSSNAVLKSFRIIAILPYFEAKKRVYLVENCAHKSEPNYVIKLLERSSSDKSTATSPSTSIIPTDIPNMVQMHKFFDLDSYVVLLLEHVRGGRLWDFLKSYFEKQRLQIDAFLFGKNQEAMNGYPSEELMIGKPLSSTEHLCDATIDADVFETLHFQVTKTLDGSATKTSNFSGFNSNSENDSQLNDYQGKHVHFSTGDADVPTDLAHGGESNNQNVKNFATNSSGSVDKDVSVQDQVLLANDTPRQHLSPFESSSVNVDDDVAASSTCAILSEAAEEAPAPIILRCQLTSSAKYSHNFSCAKKLVLLEALERVRMTLYEKSCWSSQSPLPEALVAYWIGQLTSAVYFLHSQGIIIRDLRPDNLLLDEEANLKVTYCSQWVNVDCHLETAAIRDLYVAPEVVSINKQITDAADRWSIGAILFELLCGQKLSEICLHGFDTLEELPIPECAVMSFAARDLLSKLLVTDPRKRLSDDDLRAHPFFEGFDWDFQDRIATDFYA